ncbi:MAG: hypothetical protein JWN29_1036 [Acidimicrobiales bacterium]|nr:hypothetical protein [Acidimicrobiales bacterium]
MVIVGCTTIGCMDVVRLGAWCDLVTLDEYRADLAVMAFPPEAIGEALGHASESASFRVSEFAVLADGRRVTLHAERGFVSKSSTGSPWDGLTRASIESGVRTTVLPDDDDGEDHPWHWLAELCAANGIDTTEDRLRRLLYDVEHSERHLTRLVNRD